jgi:hypothetical protein
MLRLDPDSRLFSDHLAGVKEGQKVHECATCLKKYESTVVVCDKCLPIATSEHEKSHVFASFVYRHNENVSEMHFRLRCIECAKGKDPFLHRSSLTKL